MCRAFLLQGKDVEKFPYLMHYFVNSVNKGNNDGFFLMIGDKINIRTMRFSQLLDFMYDNRELIDSEEIVAGHARLSTNIVSHKYIHGWNMNGYYCMHNGMNSITNGHGNDSWDFFNTVFRGQCRHENVLDRFYDEMVYRGYGAYIMVNPGREEYLLSAYEYTDLYCHLINNELVLINSNDDIHVFDGNLYVQMVSKYNKFGLCFKDKHDKQINCDVPIVDSDSSFKLSDSVVKIYKDDDGEYKRVLRSLPDYSYNDNSKKYWYDDEYYDEYYDEKYRRQLQGHIGGF